MYNLLIPFAIGAAVAVLIRLLHFPLLAGIIPGTIAFFAAFLVLGRRTATRVQALISAAQKELYVQDDENVKYGAVLRVMAAARAAGVEKLGMITDPLVVK